MPVLLQAQAEPLPGCGLVEPLGKGGFGEVWKCDAPGGLFKAVKIVKNKPEILDRVHICLSPGGDAPPAAVPSRLVRITPRQDGYEAGALFLGVEGQEA
jgi:hypothetical protein